MEEGGWGNEIRAMRGRNPSRAKDLRPSHGGGLRCADDGLLQEGDGVCQTLLGGHEAILMLDGHDLIVADEAEVGDHISPVVKAVAVADAAEDPGAVELVGIVLRSSKLP